MSEKSQLASSTLENIVNYKTHPWVRFFARQLDLIVWATALAIILYFIAPKILSNTTQFSFLVLFTWIFMESIIMSMWGQTLGKFLFNIEVKSNTTKPNFLRYLKRSFAVWWRGMGAGLPLIYLIALAISYKNLKEFKSSFWDIDGGFAIIHQKLTGWKIILVVGIFACFIWLIIKDYL